MQHIIETGSFSRRALYEIFTAKRRFGLTIAEAARAVFHLAAGESKRTSEGAQHLADLLRNGF